MTAAGEVADPEAACAQVAGEPVDARFTRDDGCRISRWDALSALLPTGR